MNLKELFQREVQRDLRASFADFLGYKLLSPDQERHIEMLQTQPRVAAMGGTGTGKTFDTGNAAALTLAITPTKALFGAGKIDQAALLSWLELQRALLAAKNRGCELARPAGVTEWYPRGKQAAPDWFGVCMALSERNNATSVGGMMHAERVLVCLDELNAVDALVRDALYAGTTQENAHYWASFNPVSERDAAADFYRGTPEAGRIQMSQLAYAEWQERTGIRIPGTPTLAAIAEHWKGKENEPGYYVYVLGQYPPASAQRTIVPQDWYDRLTNCVTELTPADKAQPGAGVDTGGGGAETGCCLRLGRIVMPVQAAREGHNTIAAALAVRRYLAAEGVAGAPIAVDWIGTGGKGVGEQLQASGSRVLVFRGGAKQLTELVASEVERDVARCPDDYADLVTWGYFLIHEDARRTIEAMDAERPERYISFPPDPLLREQLARHFEPDKDRKYRLEPKDSSNSPDRADMAAMASVATIISPAWSRVVTAEQIAPDLLTQGDSIGERF